MVVSQLEAVPVLPEPRGSRHGQRYKERRRVGGDRARKGVWRDADDRHRLAVEDDS
jgi:hypothetical protein